MSSLKLGITGSRLFENKTKIKQFLHNLKNQTSDEVIIVGLGDNQGADKHVKKYALEFGYTYQELNPPHTAHNLYSIMPESYHGRAYNGKNLFMRNKIYAQYVDKGVFFGENDQTDVKLKSLGDNFKKFQKPLVVIR